MMPWDSSSRGEVFVIDDDMSQRAALSRTLRAAGYDVVSFADSGALLSRAKNRVPACVVLELRMVDCTRLALLKKLRAQNCLAPVLVTSANGNIAMAVEAIRNGAIDFIQKPFDDADVLDRIEAAIEETAEANNEITELSFYLPGREPFTRREREVLARIAIGETTKEAARKLGLSSRTIEGYRASIMRKAGARNAAELLRIVLSQGREA